MVAKFQFYLDGTLVTDPKGWTDLDTTIKRDQALYSLLISQESELQFFADGHTYIKSVFDAQDFCSFIHIEIKQTCDQLNYETIFTGLIFLSEVKFGLEQCSVTVKTVDDGFYARINNNRSIKAVLNVGRSKNDTAITPAASHPIDMFFPATGLYDTNPAHRPNVFSVYECFRFLVAFMSDGLIDFVSTDFGVGGQWEGQNVTIGNEVRLWDQSVIPQISFQELFTEINKKDRIGFSVERINGRPTLRIEHAEYFYSQSSSVTLSNAKDVTMQMDTTQLYSQVHLGSSKTDSLTSLSFPEDIRFVGFKDETYHVIGTCNIDLTLDLASSWIISSNIIEDIFVNQNPSYDSDIILIDEEVSIASAKKSNWLNPVLTAPLFYNEVFNNSNVTQRWFKGIPNQIANFLGNSDNTFQATSTSDFAKIYNSTPVTFAPVKFQDDSTGSNHDVNNNYDPALFEFTIPQSGVYTLFSSETIAFQNMNPLTQNLDIKGFFDVYDNLGFAGGNLLFSVQFAHILNLGYVLISPVSISGSSNFNLVIGSKVIVRVDVVTGNGMNPSSSIIIKTGAIFSCTDSATGGGIVGTSSPENYKIKKYSFKYPITFNDLKTIKSDTKKLITFTTNNGVTKTGWIDTIKYYHHDKVSDVTLISNE